MNGMSPTPHCGSISELLSERFSSPSGASAGLRSFPPVRLACQEQREESKSGRSPSLPFVRPHKIVTAENAIADCALCSHGKSSRTSGRAQRPAATWPLAAISNGQVCVLPSAKYAVPPAWTPTLWTKLADQILSGSASRSRVCKMKCARSPRHLRAHSSTMT